MLFSLLLSSFSSFFFFLVVRKPTPILVFVLCALYFSTKCSALFIYKRWNSPLFRVLFFFFPSFLLLKKFSLFFLLSLFSQKKLQKRKKKVRLKSRRRRRKRRRREILVAFTRRKFLFTRSHSFFVVALLCGLLLSSRSYFCCIFSRDTSLEEGLLREEKGGLRFFLLGLWVRVKNVVGVLVADANAWMQILNFKCVRRVRLPAKEGLN